MKLRTAGYVPTIGILLLVTLAATAVAVATSPWGPRSVTPPPPTSGPEPTLLPVVRKGQPITNREEAIRRAIQIDASGTVREQPLTEAFIAAHPDMVVVEAYATRQEASDVYWGDRFADPAMASEPVWVVIIKGKASARVLGGMGTLPDFVETDGVTYEFSQIDGQVLRIVTGIARKLTERSP